MTEDATLDAFGSTEESAATSDATEESGAAESTDAKSANAKSTDAESADDTPTTPVPVPTSSWRPAGECASCGEHVARRWRDGDEHVCGECVSWDASGGDACDQ